MIEERALEVLVLGDLDAAEFSQLLPIMSEFREVRWHPEEVAQTMVPFDLVLLCASRPGQFSEEEVEQIRQRHPLARLIRLHGPWCYGEGRTWPPAAAIERVAWYEVPYRLRSILPSATKSRMPVTSSPQEQALASVDSIPRNTPHGEIGIITYQAEDFEPMAAACRSIGLSATWAQPGQAIHPKWTGIVAVLPGSDRPELSAIGKSLKLAGEIPKLLCVGSPTWTDWQAGHFLGFTALLGQPFLLADLAQLLIPQGDCGILPLVNPRTNR